MANELQPISMLFQNRLLVCEGDAVRLTKLGVDLSNKVLSEFLL